MKVINILSSKDGITKKYVQDTCDEFKIETSYINHNNKYNICFSTQVGCNLGCKFCYNGIKKNTE